MSEKDSVAETETEEPQAAPEAGGAQEEDIDALLNEFDGEADDPKSEPESEDDIKVIRQKVENWEREQANQKFRQDMDETIGIVRGDVDQEFFDNDMVEGWLNAQANKDPRISNAFMNRHKNPAAFKQVVNGLARQFQKRFSELPDKRLTEDRQAVASAVRGASKSAPDTDDFDRAEILRLAETNPAAFVQWQKEQSAKMKK